MGRFSGRFSWRWWPRGKNKSADHAELSFEPFDGGDRRHVLQALSAMVGGGALAAMSQPAGAKDSSELPPPRRALTARDEAGKLVPLDVKKGDKVLFGKYSGTEVKVDGDELLVMREEDVMAVIEK